MSDLNVVDVDALEVDVEVDVEEPEVGDPVEDAGAMVARLTAFAASGQSRRITRAEVLEVRDVLVALLAVV